MKLIQKAFRKQYNNLTITGSIQQLIESTEMVVTEKERHVKTSQK